MKRTVTSTILGAAVVMLIVQSLSAQGGWQQIEDDGSGIGDGYRVSAMAVYLGDLFVATKPPDGCAVWRSSDGEDWTRANLPGFGDPDSGTVYSMAVFRGELYAGTDADPNPFQLWKTNDGNTWTQVTGDAFGHPDNLTAHSMTVFDGYLYIGTYHLGGCEVWRTEDGTTWTQVQSGGFGDYLNEVAWSMSVFDGQLYVGTYNFNGAQLWRTADGLVWERMDISGLSSSADGILAITAFASHLYVGAGGSSEGAELWQSSNGTNWTRVAQDGFGDSNNRYTQTMAVFAGGIYATTNNSTTGCEVWYSINGIEWSQVNEDGFGDENNINPYSISVFDSSLYVGTINLSGCQIWRLTAEQQQAFDNGVLDYSSGNEMTGWTVAEDFEVPQSSSLSRVTFYMADSSMTSLGNWDGSLQWWVYEDSGGLPGALVAEGVGQNLSASPLSGDGPRVFEWYEVAFDLDQCVDVAGGMRYWIALHMADDWSGEDGLFWAWTGGGHYSASLAAPDGGPWTNTGHHLSFSLYQLMPNIFADGFESGNTSAWSDTVP